MSRDNIYGNDIPLGRGTVVHREPAKISIEEVDEKNKTTQIYIEQKITLSVRVLINQVGFLNYTLCQLCQAVPPMPDAAAAEYLLRNNDGVRVHFPVTECDKEERDQYPVWGWRRIDIGDGSKLACPDCVRKMQSAYEALHKPKKARKKKG
jgi:hypothetical protein